MDEFNLSEGTSAQEESIAGREEEDDNFLNLKGQIDGKKPQRGSSFYKIFKQGDLKEEGSDNDSLSNEGEDEKEISDGDVCPGTTHRHKSYKYVQRNLSKKIEKFEEAKTEEEPPKNNGSSQQKKEVEVEAELCD